MNIDNSSGCGIADTLTASYFKGTGTRNGKEREFIAVCIGNGQMNNISMKPIGNTLDTMDDVQKVMYPDESKKRKYIVRRLTPTECARLQGFPDGWTDGADGSDSAKYKLWGNGIALPCAEDVIGRIARALREGSE